jgi:two-component system, OmpR family, sensor kinase
VSLRARLLGAVTYVLLLAIVAFGVPLALSLSARVNAEVRTQAQAQADLVAATAGDLIGPASRPELRTLVRTAASSLRGRVLIVNAGGRVLVDSAGSSEIGTSYRSRPEIEGALAGRQVQLQRASKTLGKQILATAVPIIHNGRTAGAVRVTQSVSAVHHAVLRVELAIALIGLIVLALGLLAGSLLAGQIGRPLRRLELVARRVAQGDLRARAEVEGSLEQRSLSGSFNDMTDRMARLLSAQQDFVADASHQLRTPLTGLRLRLDEAKAIANGSEAVGELDAAIGEVDRLSHTVDELLTLSREGERPLAGACVDLGDLVTDALRRWRPEASERRITLVRERDGAAGTVWAARADLERALDALIENALRYSPSPSTVTMVDAPGRIEIRDRGPGVPPGERELVFERFRRGSVGLAGPPGHGLGLPIARELAREWGGEITIEGRDGGGAAAILELERDETPSEQRDRGFASA